MPLTNSVLESRLAEIGRELEDLETALSEDDKKVVAYAYGRVRRSLLIEKGLIEAVLGCGNCNGSARNVNSMAAPCPWCAPYRAVLEAN